MGATVSGGVEAALQSASPGEVAKVVADLTPEQRSRLQAALPGSAAAPVAAAVMLSANAGHDALKAHVVTVVTSWQENITDPKSEVGIKVVTESGLGGGTFKFFLNVDRVCTPAAVVLHIRGEEERPFRSLRMASSQACWAANGVSPGRLAEGRNWFIDPFEGEQSQVSSDDEAFTVGNLIARMHLTDNSSWFDPFRQEILCNHPSLQDVDCASSHVWQILCRAEHRLKKPLGGVCDEEGERERIQAAWPHDIVVAFCDGGAFKPAHAALRRVVSFHGDLHNKNMIMQDTEEGKSFKVIDYEFVGVGPAVIDIAMILNNTSPALPYTFKTKLIEGYFSGIQLEAPSKEEVDQILLDCAIYLFGMWADDVGYFDLCRSSAEEFHRQSTLAQEFARGVRSSAEMCTKVVTDGNCVTDLWHAQMCSKS